MRTNFYELLAKREFDAKEEYGTLWYLFFEEKSIIFAGRLYKLSEFVDVHYFRSLPFRGSFTSLQHMLSALRLTKSSAVTINRLYVFCEFLFAVLPSDRVRQYPVLKEQRATIFQNIRYILEQTNHEFKETADGNGIIVEKNKTATLASQLVDDDVVAFELIEYNHFAIKGDLESKKKLLFSIGAYIEPILKSKVLQKNGYKQLESDAGFLLNSFHIRHNNKVGAKAQEYITTVTDTELEEWYDKTYEVALSVIIINDYLSIGKDIADIKSKYTWKT